MRVTATTAAPLDVDADTIAVGVFEDEAVAHDHGDALQALVDSGEAKRGLRKLAVTHAAGRRIVLVGLGAREGFTPERARIAAAVALGRARELGARRLCWELPHHVGDAHAAAIVDGTLGAAYRFTELKSAPSDDAPAPEALILSAHYDVGAAVRHGEIVGAAVNAARDLQNRPGNVLTPAALADRAQAVAGVEAVVLDRAGIEAAGMGAFAAVARGSDVEPRLITLRYEPADAVGPLLGLVGKAVTFDSGGISLKPAPKMGEMKFDMSGGAAVLAATEAIAALRLPIRLVSVIGATENMPSGRAVKPGDVVRAKTGTTIEVLNTDAEGRLVLADCLAHAVEQGAERLVDLATLTGAIVTTFGGVYAGLFASDDDWSAQLTTAGEAGGERLWRLPLHEEYAKAIEGRYADVANAVEDRRAGSIVAAEFLRRFVGDVPWAHLDIAGTAWDRGLPYADKGGAGYGVRTLVALAEALVAAG